MCYSLTWLACTSHELTVEGDPQLACARYASRSSKLPALQGSSEKTSYGSQAEKEKRYSIRSKIVNYLKRIM